MTKIVSLIVSLKRIYIPQLKTFLNRHDHKFPDVVQDAVKIKISAKAAAAKKAVPNKAGTSTKSKPQLPPPPRQQWAKAAPNLKVGEDPNHNPVGMGLEVLPVNDPRIEMSKFEAEMDPYGVAEHLK